ncbi:zinc finger protein 280C [Scleropages formosus]|uniref:zinc finger protein 280C n=1 Tax=Scleropages formosus TaxID=113540 RepID=UPI0010FA9986|nr:zinc finger protein 280D [Scleropages formosus]
MSELFMECEEEELEPWQRRIPEINLVDDDDDDEPIFVGEICGSKVSPNTRPSAAPVLKVVKSPNQRRTPPSSVRSAAPMSPGPRFVSGTVTNPNRPPQTSSSTQSVSSGPSKLTIRAAPQPVTKSLLIPVTSQAGSLPVVAQNVSHTITAVTPQPIIINNQGYILTSHETPNNSAFIASLGSQYSGGTSFTVLPAGPQLLPQVTAARTMSGVVHRPQVQLVQNNIVTLANMPSPSQHTQPSAQFASNDLQPMHMSSAMLHPVQVGSSALQSKLGTSPRQQPSPQPLPALHTVTMKGNTSGVKRDFPLDSLSPAKKTKLENVIGSCDASGNTQNGTPFRQKCPKCNIQFNLPDPMKSHMRYCCYHLMHTIFPSTPMPGKTSNSAQDWQGKKGKLIMLVTEFYYGRHEGDEVKEQKTNTTFKCSSCLKVLKNNIRFMNHMKHHLELEKQSNESWESHTTCQHCYRQYATPFQLQCHIESAHSPYESTTICKICELAFETEQALLEHMKASHKPGEMPYVCQVCNYRSSFFSEVESHFRSVHENTKDLLCPFCLKVLRSGHTYMQHYMKHQNKGIHRCGKCRLNFLTQKEKMDHKIQFHRTFKKPKILEGLPPGTKVTIRASFSGGSPSSPSSPTSPNNSAISVISCSPPAKRLGRPPLSSTKCKSTQSSGTGRPKGQSRKQDRHQQLQDKSNHMLKTLRNESGVQTCIECSTKISDFFLHFPATMSCSACKYQTSCSKSFGNHMIRFHSAVSWDRLRKMRKPQNSMRSMTLVCLNCDFLEDATGSDLMTKHLVDRPHHTCQVIIEKEVCSGAPTNTQLGWEAPVEVDTVRTKEDEYKTNLCGHLDSSPDTEGTKKADGIPDVNNKLGVLQTSDCEAPCKSCKEEDAGEVKASEGGGQAEAVEQGTGEVPHLTSSPVDFPQDDKKICEAFTQLGSVNNGGVNGEDGGLPGEGVPFEEFLRRADKSESTDFSGSEQNSIHLEPLTPSKVLEHEATEILQKGSTSPSENNGGAAPGWDCSRPSTPDKPNNTN